MFIYFWERERERQSASKEGAEREREIQNPKQAPGSALSAEPNTELKPTSHEIMSWAEVGRLTDWATQATHDILIF